MTLKTVFLWAVKLQNVSDCGSIQLTHLRPSLVEQILETFMFSLVKSIPFNINLRQVNPGSYKPNCLQLPHKLLDQSLVHKFPQSYYMFLRYFVKFRRHLSLSFQVISIKKSKFFLWPSFLLKSPASQKHARSYFRLFC